MLLWWLIFLGVVSLPGCYLLGLWYVNSDLSSPSRAVALLLILGNRVWGGMFSGCLGFALVMWLDSCSPHLMFKCSVWLWVAASVAFIICLIVAIVVNHGLTSFAVGDERL